MKAIETGVVLSSPNDAFSRKLPIIGFKVDYRDTMMHVEQFPEGERYLRLHRPPSGSLEFTVDAYQSKEHNHEELVRQINIRYGGNGYHPLILGKQMKLEIDNLVRVAKRFYTGKNLNRKEWVSALIPSPNGGPYGLLLSFGCYIGTQNTKKQAPVTEHHVHKSLIEGFHLVEN